MTQGKNIAVQDYMEYIRENKAFIERYIALDVIGDPEMTYDFYKIMRKKGFNPMPVYHYGTDKSYLKQYVAEGNDYITLGGTVPIVDKRKVARWASQLIKKYPGVKFHLLGSCSTPIMFCEGLSSCDSSTWILQAINGNPKHISGKTKDKKLERAKFNLIEIQGRIELLM